MHHKKNYLCQNNERPLPLPQPLQIFIAYARKDSTYLDELRTHLNPLERSGKVNIWYDGKIEPGAVWEESIKKHLHAADVILLLVSADAINSDYFYEKEMTDALARHHAGEARVVPLIVRSCLWQATPLQDLQALPKDGRPVTSWPDRDDAYNDAVGSLWTMIENFAQQQREEKERLERERRNREAEARRAQEALFAAEKEAQRKKLLEKENARRDAEKQRKLEEQRRQADAARLKNDKEARQRKAAATRQREQQLATLGRGMRSPWAWGSGLALAALFIFKMWVCNGPTEQLPTAQLGGDTTTLAPSELVDAEQGVMKLSPQNMPPDVTVAAPKQEEKKPAAKPAEEKKQPEKTSPSPKPSAARKSGFEMVPVPGGTFTMGSPENEEGRGNDECPHSVTVSGFSIGKYEVTQADWREVMGNNPSNFKNCDDCPVENVSWDDIQEFLKKASKKYGKRYRLPTEEEWEYAARGGNRSKNYTYSGSNNLGSVAWYGSNSGSKTHPVGTRSPNELGIYDMSGNVWEWCADKYGPFPGCSGSSSVSRVLRGGSWYDYPVDCRTATRLRLGPAYRSSRYGFRLVSVL